MHFFKLKKLAGVLLSLSTLALVSQAHSDDTGDLGRDVASWLQKHGASVVDTNAQHYNTSGRGIYTGGAVSFRTPNYYMVPFTVSAPDIKTGCGGVDLYFGSFSYLKKEELERFARQVMANAPYFAFKIALSSYSEKINSVLSELQSMAQLLSSTQLDACSTSEYMVNSLDAAFRGETDRPRTLQNTFAAISAGFEGNKLDARRKDGTVVAVESVMGLAGAYKVSASSNVKSGGSLEINVRNDRGELETKSVPNTYKEDQVITKVQTLEHCSSAPSADDKLDAHDLQRHPEKYDQNTAICKIQKGEEGNAMWKYSDKWLMKLLATAKAEASNAKSKTLSLVSAYADDQKALELFVYSLLGTHSQFNANCTTGDNSTSKNITRTLTLQKLIQGGDYRPIVLTDYVCSSGVKLYKSDISFEAPVKVSSPVDVFMEKWGAYDGEKVFKVTDNTTIAHFKVPQNQDQGSGYYLPEYTEMEKLLGQKVTHAIIKHAQNDKFEVAAKIARRCFYAKLLKNYYSEVLSIKDLVYQALEDTGDTAVYTREFLKGMEEDLDSEYQRLFMEYGDPDSTCITNAGGVSRYIETENSSVTTSNP